MEVGSQTTPLPLQKGPSHIKVKVLGQWLARYPRKEDTAYFFDGYQLGFRIPVTGEWKAAFANNLKSVIGMEDMVRAKIGKEV